VGRIRSTERRLISSSPWSQVIGRGGVLQSPLQRPNSSSRALESETRWVSHDRIEAIVDAGEEGPALRIPQCQLIETFGQNTPNAMGVREELLGPDSITCSSARAWQ
jgi:hypothetical protein